MAQTPERSIPEKVFRAHTLAGKAHKDGAKPLTRLGAAMAIGAIGVGGEILVDTVRPVALKKVGLDDIKLPKLFDQLLNDGLVGVAYTVANKNLSEALPKLKLRHFTTSAAGTMVVFGGETVQGKIGERLSAWRKSRDNKVTQSPPIETAAPKTSASTTESKKSLLDYINPVTALAADEARMAFADWLDAYKAVSAGTEEAFVSTHTPKDEKEPAVIKETTTIIFANDQQLASAFAGVPKGGSSSSSS